MRRRRSLIRSAALALVVLATALPLWAAGAQGAAPGLVMEARPALGGYFKYGEWLPVWLLVENNGPDLAAEARVSLTDSGGTTTYVAPADLPGGSRKRIPLYVLPSSFTHQLEIRLVSGDRLLASEKVDVRPQPNVHYLVGLVSPQRGALALIDGVQLPGQNRPIILIDLALADLPDRVEGLRSLNTLVINALDTSVLTTEQQTALETWVRQGGRLVIGGGASARQALSGLPASLAPLDAIEVAEVQALPGLETFAKAEAVRVPGPFVVAAGEGPGARRLAGEAELPLVLEWAVERGFVNFVALDLATSPFDAWVGTGSFWEALLSPGAEYPEWLPFDMSVRQTRAGSMPYALSNLPALDLPSIRGLSILLAVYIVLIGPVNFLVLRWRRRLHLAWATTPLFTLVFSAGAFTLGYALRGTDLILNKIAIVEVQPGGDASVSSYLGLFSPSQRSYQIEVAGESLLSPLRMEGDPWNSSGAAIPLEMVFQQGNPGAVRGLAVNQWSMQSFMAESAWPDFGSISADLQLAGQVLQGSLTNGTAFTLQDAVLLLGSRFVRLGDLEPGQTKEARLVVETLTGQPFEPSISYQIFQEQLEKPMPNGPPRDIQLKQAVLDSVFPWGNWYGPVFGANASMNNASNAARLMLLAWIDQAPPEVSVSGRLPLQHATALVLQPLSFRLPAGERVSLAPGFLTGRVVQMNDAGYCGPMGLPAVYLGRQEVVFEFQLPEELLTSAGNPPLQVDSLVLNVGTEPGWEKVPSISLFDWSKAEWQELQEPVSGNNPVAEGGRFVDAQGRVQVRLSPQNFLGGGCFQLAVGLEGRR